MRLRHLAFAVLSASVALFSFPSIAADESPGVVVELVKQDAIDATALVAVAPVAVHAEAVSPLQLCHERGRIEPVSAACADVCTIAASQDALAVPWRAS